MTAPENTRDLINAFGAHLAAIRSAAKEDWVIVSVGARGPNYDCYEGNMVATIRRGNDEATSEALYLYDAMCLAAGKIDRERAAKAEAKNKAAAK